MSASSVIIVVAVAALAVAYALGDLGADHLVASFGRAVVRTVTFGRIRLSQDTDDSSAIGAAAFTVVGLFMLLLLVAASLT